MRAKLFLLCIYLIPAIRLSAQNPTEILTYIQDYKETAISEMRRSGIPAAIILAQGIHETEAGTSELVKKSNNHFGIKCKDSWTGAVVYHDDDKRGECFRSYNQPSDSYRDHSDFLRNSARYAFLFTLDPMDYQSWAYGLKKAGYATNIRYPQILIKLIEDYNLQQYTLIGLGKQDPQETETAQSEMEKPASATNIHAALAPSAENKAMVSPAPGPHYPQGEFVINRTRVIYAHAGTSMLVVAGQYNIPLSRLLDFNDMQEEDVLVNDQLLYLQRKRKTGENEFHTVQNGETLYSICQAEGIRFEALLELNQLRQPMQPATGEKLYLQNPAPARPLLAMASDQKATPHSREENRESRQAVTSKE